MYFLHRNVVGDARIACYYSMVYTAMPITREDQILFRLRCFCRFDEQVQAFVGYIPRLQIFAQSPTEDGLRDAASATALRFLMACADRGILSEIMQESRMQKVSDFEDAETVVADHDTEYIGYRQCEPIEVTIPIDALIGAAQATFA